ncbi:MAG TPA: methyltransferase [Steroidobacteraceae bacterium]|nr:methyltransferase [Steroidobacteraceae bacterium]
MLDLTDAALTPEVRGSLRPSRFPVFSRLAGKVLTYSYRLLGRHRYDDYRLERVLGAPLVVMPSVFNPKLPRTGEFLARQLTPAFPGGDAEVLDMGTGSGVGAVIAARHARRIVAVDINTEAVRCAGINVRLNRVEGRVEVRQGDLFGPVRDERFDLILFNPPFLRGTPSDDRERAWRSSDVAERFAAGVAQHLKPAGAALVLLSTFGGAEHFLEQFRRQALAIAVHAERRFVNEKLVIFRLTSLA